MLPDDPEIRVLLRRLQGSCFTEEVFIVMRAYKICAFKAAHGPGDTQQREQAVLLLRERFKQWLQSFADAL